MAPYHFWTQKSFQDQTTPSSHRFTGSQHTQINIYIWTAITTQQLKTVCTIHWHIVKSGFQHTTGTQQGIGPPQECSGSLPFPQLGPKQTSKTV